MSSRTEKLSAPYLINPEPEHTAWENIYYVNQHILSWVLSALGSTTRVISGSITGGQITNLKILFNLSDNTRHVVSFPNTAVSVEDSRKIYYADYTTRTILSVELPGFDDFDPDENKCPIAHAVRYHDTAVTTADRIEWIAPRTDIYGHIPIGTIIASHPHAPAPDSYFFKFCDGNGHLGDNFDGHETDSIPNLTDARFLAGANAYGMGGSNVIRDHTHTCANQDTTHTHSGTTLTENQTHTHLVNPIPSNSGYNSHDHQHTLAIWTREGLTGRQIGASSEFRRNRTTSSQNQNHYHAIDIPSGASGSESQYHTHAVTTGSESTSHKHQIGSGDIPINTECIPRYFNVKYYIRVN